MSLDISLPLYSYSYCRSHESHTAILLWRDRCARRGDPWRPHHHPQPGKGGQPVVVAVVGGWRWIGDSASHWPCRNRLIRGSYEVYKAYGRPMYGTVAPFSDPEIP